MEKEELDSMLKSVSPQVRQNYNLFQIDKANTSLVSEGKSGIKYKEFMRKDDPFYLRQRYIKRNHKVLKTNELLEAIDPLDLKELKLTNKSQVKHTSRRLLEAVCDKEKQFYG